MSDQTKDWLSKWAPLLFAIATNISVVAYGYGKMAQKIEPLEEHASIHTTEKAISLFVTRSEFAMSNMARDRELADIKAGLASANDKLDRLIERSKK
jgi:hypothetical protein